MERVEDIKNDSCNSKCEKFNQTNIWNNFDLLDDSFEQNLLYLVTLIAMFCVQIQDDLTLLKTYRQSTFNPPKWSYAAKVNDVEGCGRESRSGDIPREPDT